jgi:hypothetical protein
MPSLEGPPVHNESDRDKEQESLPYYLAARYPHEKPAGRAYLQAQRVIFNAQDTSDLSAYRFQLPQLYPGYYVAVLGAPPAEELHQKLQRILLTGEATSLPAEALQFLQARRRRAAQLGSWVEGHYRPGPKHRLRAPLPRPPPVCFCRRRAIPR